MRGARGAWRFGRAVLRAWRCARGVVRAAPGLGDALGGWRPAGWLTGWAAPWVHGARLDGRGLSNRRDNRRVGDSCSGAPRGAVRAPFAFPGAYRTLSAAAPYALGCCRAPFGRWWALRAQPGALRPSPELSGAFRTPSMTWGDISPFQASKMTESRLATPTVTESRPTTIGMSGRRPTTPTATESRPTTRGAEARGKTRCHPHQLRPSLRRRSRQAPRSGSKRGGTRRQQRGSAAAKGSKMALPALNVPPT